MKDYVDQYTVAMSLIQRTQGASIKELSEVLDKTERAVYNLLNQMNNSFPIYSDTDPEYPKRLRYYCDNVSAKFLPNLSFSEVDKAFYNYLIDNSKNVPALNIAANYLFNKLKIMAAERGSLIEKDSSKPLAIVSTRNVVKNIDNKQTQTVSNALLAAIKEKEWVTLKYKKLHDDESYSKTVFPKIMFVSNGDCYVYVLNEDEEIRMLAVERIEKIVKTEKKAAPKKQIDTKALFNDPFGAFIDSEPFTIKLFIDNSQDCYEKARKWPKGVKFEDTEGGSIMTITTGCKFDAKRWILKRTPDVKVIEPQWLAEEITDSLKSGLNLYGIQ